MAKADDDNAQLVYILRFQPEAYKRDVTVKLDGETLVTWTDKWAWDNDIYVEFLDGISELVHDGYNLSYTVTYGDGEPTAAASLDFFLANRPALSLG